MTRRQRQTLIATLTLTLLLAISKVAPAQTLLIDTGQPTGGSVGSIALFGSGSSTCSPQPACAAHFQFLAAQFTLHQAATLDSVEAWMGAFGTGGTLAVKIRSDNNGLPGQTTPPFLGPISIYSKSYVLGNRSTAGWVTFSNYDAVLAAGTYWLTFEPVAPGNFNYSMPKGAPNPLAKYAFYGDGNPGYLAINPNPGFGIRIAGTNFPGVAFGTATRTILPNPFGFYDFINGGEGDASTVSYIFVIPLGFDHGRGRIIENGLTAGAYSFQSSNSLGAGRGVAYRTWVNSNDHSVTFRANAILHGRFGLGGGHATAGVYVFDPTLFKDTVDASGVGVAEFLLRRDGINELAGGSVSLVTLFPSTAVLGSDQRVVTGPINQSFTVPFATNLITVAPDQAFTIMFDVSADAANGGSSQFADTLSQAPDFFTDVNGNPVTGLIAVGPSLAPAAPPTALVLTPPTATTPVGTPHNVIATVTSANGMPVPDATVVFSITAGPNAGFIESVVSDANGQATLTYSGGAGLGTDSIQANIEALQSNAVQNTWEPGELDQITIAPSNASMAAGGSQTYTAEAFDKFTNSRGDVTNVTTFSILPDGSCTGPTCTATTAGAHTVTASYNGTTATATLTVTAATSYDFNGFFSPIDMSTSGVVVWNIAKAGQTIPTKWRLTTNGLPVSDPASFAGLISYPVSCTSGTGAIEDAIEELTTGESLLRYNGDGNWQYNWKTPTFYKGTCRVMVVRFKDGTASLGANFKFK